jgi:Zn ribbon nucleic-acid-binding protein
LDVVLQKKQLIIPANCPKIQDKVLLWDSRENLKQDFEGEECLWDSRETPKQDDFEGEECLWDSRETPKQDFEGRTQQWVQS